MHGCKVNNTPHMANTGFTQGDGALHPVTLFTKDSDKSELDYFCLRVIYTGKIKVQTVAGNCNTVADTFPVCRGMPRTA